jgi:CMP/dCMP kinase
MIITIDGPAGSGKSTVAAKLAEKVGIGYLDTGAMYRAVTWGAIAAGIDLDNAGALGDYAAQCRIEMHGSGDKFQIRLDGRDITAEIRTPELTNQSHKAANNPRVRAVLVKQQRRIAVELGSAVTEGRDQGTVAFPEATVKFYLNASAPCRAGRRWEQLRSKGIEADYERILSDQQQRDARDAGREVGPLKAASDAIVIDTTEMNIEKVVERMCREVEKVKSGKQKAEIQD